MSPEAASRIVSECFLGLVSVLEIGRDYNRVGNMLVRGGTVGRVMYGTSSLELYLDRCILCTPHTPLTSHSIIRKTHREPPVTSTFLPFRLYGIFPVSSLIFLKSFVQFGLKRKKSRGDKDKNLLE